MGIRDLSLQSFSLLILLAVLTANLSFPTTVSAQKGAGNISIDRLPSKDKRWALIVGIDEYQNDVSTLKGSVNDARALKNVLVENAGFPENQIILLTTDSFEPDRQPTRENILGALSDLYSKVPEDGLLLFSFSGHGISTDDGKQAFLIPSNGRFTKNLTLLKNFSIDVETVKEAIREIKVKQVLMLLDACRNEPGKGDVPNRLTNAYKNGFSFDVANSDVRAFATLYATSIGERAFEFYDQDAKQFRGYFSYAVEEALKGKAANEKGEITLSRLIDYLETTVPKKVKWDKGETQIPSADYSETYRANQLILAVADKENNLLSPAQIAWSNFRQIAKKILKYDCISQFSEGLSGVCKDKKTGFIDKSGNEIIPIKYDSAGYFSEGLARVTFNNKCGFVNKIGKAVIPIRYEDCSSFSEGLSAVKMDDKWGFIDRSEKVIIDFQYQDANPFSEGLASVRPNYYFDFIDKTGKVKFSTDYDYAAGFSEGLSAVGKSDFTGESTPDGDPYIKFTYGFIDKTGKLIVDIKYDDFLPFSAEGLALVSLNDKVNFIDKTGKEIISFKYDSVEPFSNGLAKVTLNDKSGFIDKTGMEVIPVKYDKIWCWAFESEGFIGVFLNGKKGFVDLYGNEYFDF